VNSTVQVNSTVLQARWAKFAQIWIQSERVIPSARSLALALRSSIHDTVCSTYYYTKCVA
jgi:hypothetical protein